MADNVQEQSDTLDPMLQRARQLHNEGFDWSQAWGQAFLEHRIDQWPSGWGDDLEVLIYGDFEPPATELAVQPLGITVYPEKLKDTVITSATCVLRAKVKVKEKSVEALIDAARRINVFLGAWSLVAWGNAACGWWSWVTHGTASGTVPTLVLIRKGYLGGVG